jgi:hypothetical protein
VDDPWTGRNRGLIDGIVSQEEDDRMRRRTRRQNDDIAKDSNKKIGNKTNEFWCRDRKKENWDISRGTKRQGSFDSTTMDLLQHLKH